MPSNERGATGPVRPLTIGIPLRSARNSPDWALTCRLLDRTLASIAHQTMAPARVIIACHETPSLNIPASLDIEFIRAPFDPPRFLLETKPDGLKKKELIGARHRAHGGGMLFLLDADDLLEREFIATVTAVAAKAVIIKRGYKVDWARERVTLLPRFWRLCGSCAVVDWRPEELPEVALGDADSVFRRCLDTRHYDWPALFEGWGWKIDYVDRPVVMYVLNHGQNISVVNKRTWRWRLYHALLPHVALKADFLGRFGVSGSLT